MASDGSDPGAAPSAPFEDGPDRSLPLDSNQAGALAYLLGAVTGVLMLVVTEGDDFVQFHAIQSITLTFTVLLVYMVLSLAIAFLDLFPVVGGAVDDALVILYPVFGAATLGVWVLSMYRAYAGDWFQIPLVGVVAARSRAAPPRLRR